MFFLSALRARRGELSNEREKVRAAQDAHAKSVKDMVSLRDEIFTLKKEKQQSAGMQVLN